MTGIFACWQPEYSRHGIATFPLKVYLDDNGKKKFQPAVANFRKMGRPASAQLARKYADAQALGFCNGRHSGVTVIDYDTRDEGLLGEGTRIFGESPLRVRTNGGFHAYYRHNGEQRRIRPIPGLDLDILGDGGFTVAAPSKGRDRLYEFVRGTLDALDSLPTANMPAEIRDASAGPRTFLWASAIAGSSSACCAMRPT